MTGPLKLADQVTLEDFWDAWFGSGTGYGPEMTAAFAALGVEFTEDALDALVKEWSPHDAVAVVLYEAWRQHGYAGGA